MSTLRSTEDQVPDRYWVRSSEAVVRVVDGETFLAAPSRGSIHALNPLASAVWRTLESPRTFPELCALFESAFPEVEASRIRDDLRGLLETLEKDGLVSQLAS